MNLIETVGKKIEIQSGTNGEPVYLAVFGHEADSGYYWGYMVNPKTRELYHRFASRLEGVHSIKILESLSEDEAKLE